MPKGKGYGGKTGGKMPSKGGRVTAGSSGGGKKK